MSSVGGMTSVTQGQPATQNSNSSQATQHRVARICETGDDAKHGELVFDFRSASHSHFSGDVNVVHFFIGDVEDDLHFTGHVRAVVDEMGDNDEELYKILWIQEPMHQSFLSVCLERESQLME